MEYEEKIYIRLDLYYLHKWYLYKQKDHLDVRKRKGAWKSSNDYLQMILALAGATNVAEPIASVALANVARLGLVVALLAKAIARISLVVTSSYLRIPGRREQEHRRNNRPTG